MKKGMRTRRKKRIFLLMLLALWSASSLATQTVVWDKTVIPIELLVGVEQLVHFDGTVSPGLSPLLSKKDYFRVLSTNGTVYMTALQAFGAQRVKFRTESGEFILMDIRAKATKTPPARVQELHIVSKHSGAPSEGTTVASAAAPSLPDVSMFDVLRYGAQAIYAPARVIKPVSGIMDVGLKIKGDLKELYKGDGQRDLSIRVTKSWQSQGIHVTALKVRNTGVEKIPFDPSKLQHTRKRVINGVNNQFKAVALLGSTSVLGGKHRPDSSTYVLVVTDLPFASVLDL